MDSREARVLMVAIALQETQLRARHQVVFRQDNTHARGPAVSLWQFEPIGIRGVMGHHASSELLLDVCKQLLVPYHEASIYEAMPWCDPLAAAAARLLLWRDPRPLATTQADGWAYYLRGWRPGKPHKERWQENWFAALEAVNAWQSP